MPSSILPCNSPQNSKKYSQKNSNALFNKNLNSEHFDREYIFNLILDFFLCEFGPFFLFLCGLYIFSSRTSRTL